MRLSGKARLRYFVVIPQSGSPTWVFRTTYVQRVDTTSPPVRTYTLKDE